MNRLDFEKYDNFIFDLYGTLIHLKTDEHCAKTWKKWLKWLDQEKIKHPDYIRFRNDFFIADKAARQRALEEGNFTDPEIDVIDIYRDLFFQYGNKALSDAQLKKISYAFRQSSIEYIELYPGVIDFLDKIRSAGKHAYILSNAQATYTEPEILGFELDKHIDAYYMSSDYKCMKPDVHFYEALFLDHPMDHSKTVMIGDSDASDMAGAKNAGISGIHLVGDNHPMKFYIE